MQGDIAQTQISSAESRAADSASKALEIVVNGSVTGDIFRRGAENYQLSRLQVRWEKIPDPNNISAMLQWRSRIPEKKIGGDKLQSAGGAELCRLRA